MLWSPLQTWFSSAKFATGNLSAVWLIFCFKDVKMETEYARQ